MSKFKKIQQLKALAKINVSCNNCSTTTPMKFKGFIATKFYKPTKAEYCCENCTSTKEVHYTKHTYWNRFSELVVNPIVPQSNISYA